MADINIERKRPSLWLWFVGVILLIAVIYLAAQFLGNRAAEPADTPPAQTTQ